MDAVRSCATIWHGRQALDLSGGDRVDELLEGAGCAVGAKEITKAVERYGDGVPLRADEVSVEVVEAELARAIRDGHLRFGIDNDGAEERTIRGTAVNLGKIAHDDDCSVVRPGCALILDRSAIEDEDPRQAVLEQDAIEVALPDELL